MQIAAHIRPLVRHTRPGTLDNLLCSSQPSRLVRLRVFRLHICSLRMQGAYRILHQIRRGYPLSKHYYKAIYCSVMHHAFLPIKNCLFWARSSKHFSLLETKRSMIELLIVYCLSASEKRYTVSPRMLWDIDQGLAGYGEVRRCEGAAFTDSGAWLQTSAAVGARPSIKLVGRSPPKSSCVAVEASRACRSQRCPPASHCQCRRRARRGPAAGEVSRHPGRHTAHRCLCR